jgi:DNA polymerase III delta prime subunit
MRQQEEKIIPSLSVFISYAHEDEVLRGELEKHLSLLQRKGIIATWQDRQILPGADWSQELDSHLNTASLILLLISPDFLASDYCYGIEMHRALERHRAGTAHVIPIILRPVDWHGAPFAYLQCLPRDAQPVTRQSDRDEAWLAVATGIRTILEEQQRLRLTPSHKRENRERLLKRVQVFWIEGVLEQSLNHATRIELGLQEQPDALSNPWQLTVQDMNQAPRQVAAGTPLVEIYDATRGELLILGEPGAGKTTLLLELARDLIARADQNNALPIPVVFNLSSWGEKHYPLVRWLIEELESKYQVPRKLGRMWMAQERILPLLDGLDEVKQEARSACIAAVNVYRTQHQQTSLVVCSRTTEYFTQEQRLTFLRAVTIQPLTAQQIDASLTISGKQLEAVQEIMRMNTVLRDLITTPLLLNVLVLASQGRSLQDLQRSGSHEVQQQLFAMYVQRMLARRGRDPRFPEQQTIRWLSWLAQQMARHSQSTFFIEQMQPSWLSGHWVRWIHRIIVGLIVILLWALAGLFLGLSFEGFGGSGALPVILIIGLIAGSIVGFSSLFRTEIKLAERVTWSRKKALIGLGGGLGIGLLVFQLLTGLTMGRICMTPTHMIGDTY